MAVRVRVKNFQSLEDAEIVIDGFTSISGPNNSGKTALMRAIRGLFTNAPYAPLLRSGAAFLSVEIEFDDGTLILWEKGTERPDGKGKGINRYTLNGKVLEGVGRGVPPEVENLGVRAVSAGNQTIWPQVAEQFDGTLFLLNRSGAVVAEALSDVEKVGKLTSALRLSEKDRRAASTELKIRRDDMADAEREYSKYEGLEEVGVRVRAISALEARAQTLGSEFQEAQRLGASHRSALASEKAYRGFSYREPSPEAALSLSGRLKEATGVRAALRTREAQEARYKGYGYSAPDSERALKIQGVLKVAREYREKHGRYQETVTRLAGFDAYSSPDSERALKLQRVLTTCIELRARKVEAEDQLEAYSFCEVPLFPGIGEVTGISEELHAARDIQRRLTIAKSALQDLAREEEVSAASLVEAEKDVSRLLGDRGVCPTCNTVHAPL